MRSHIGQGGVTGFQPWVEDCLLIVLTMSAVTSWWTWTPATLSASLPGSTPPWGCGHRVVKAGSIFSTGPPPRRGTETGKPTGAPASSATKAGKPSFGDRQPSEGCLGRSRRRWGGGELPPELRKSVTLASPPAPASSKRRPLVQDGTHPLHFVREGRRNNAIFEVLRRWAYLQDKGEACQPWLNRVLMKVQDLNAQLLEPLPGSEVGSVCF